MATIDPRDVLHYEPETGVLTWTAGRRAGRVAGCVTTTLQGSSYRVVKIDGQMLYAHRVIWFIVNGHWPEAMIDHINGDGLDNRLENLREATRAQNGQNRRLDQRSKTGVTGVHFDRNQQRYKVHVQTNGVREYLGSFVCRDDAVRIANQARAHRHGPFANL